MINFSKITEELRTKRGFCFLPHGFYAKPIKGIRTNAWTGEEKEVNIKYEIRYKEGNERAFWLIGGPTGYESFNLDRYFEETKNWMIEKGWTACAGTLQRWDKLVIPAEEMKRVFEEEGLL